MIVALNFYVFMMIGFIQFHVHSAEYCNLTKLQLNSKLNSDLTKLGCLSLIRCNCSAITNLSRL